MVYAVYGAWYIVYSPVCSILQNIVRSWQYIVSIPPYIGIRVAGHSLLAYVALGPGASYFCSYQHYRMFGGRDLSPRRRLRADSAR